MIDLVAINRRLANRKFLSGPSDESFFNHLICQIQGLTRPGEMLVLPDFAEQDGWAKGWALYQALLRRAPDPAAVRAEADGRAVADHSRRMNQCADDTAALKAFRDRNRPSWEILCEYIGFDEQDLDPPPADPRFGVAEGWEKRAQRVAGALQRLAGMSDRERQEIPAKVEERRLKRHLRETERRLAEIEQRLAALESGSPSHRSLNDAMMA